MVRHLVACGTESANVLVFELKGAELDFVATVAAAQPPPRALPKEKKQGLGKLVRGDYIAVEWVQAHGAHFHALVCCLDRREGELVTFACDGNPLRMVAATPTAGYQPCHAHTRGRWLAVAHFLTGNVSLFDVQDGAPRGGAPTCVVNLEDSRPDAPSRPTLEDFKLGGIFDSRPMAHGVCFHPQGQWLVAVDVGLSKLNAWRFDERAGVLAEPAVVSPVGPPPVLGGRTQRYMARKAGSRPRHLVFIGSDGRQAAVNHENASRITIHTFDVRSGIFAPAAYVVDARGELKAGPSLLRVFLGPLAGPAELGATTDGRFLIHSNRGVTVASSLRLFRMEHRTSAGGKLAASEPVAIQDVKVDNNPRHFLLVDDVLFVGHAKSVATFRFSDHGQLEPVARVALPQGARAVDCLALLTLKS